MSKVLRNILYVDDEADIQRVVKLALETVAGMQVIACSTGAEAIACAASTAIDLILLDVMMPQMDGPTTLAHLRKIPALANVPVVFMTAKTHRNEIEYFKSLGALDVIPKPFDPMTLAPTLRGVWARATSVPPPAAAVEEISPEARFAARMAALTEKFRRELPARRHELQQHWTALNDVWNIDTLTELHHCAHNLAGAGSTFGYDELTARARAFDRQLKLLLAQQQAPDNVLWVEISALYDELETELQRILT